jgi:hypothetical protein
MQAVAASVTIRNWKGTPVKQEDAPKGALIIRHVPPCPKCEGTSTLTQIWLERYGDYHAKVWKCLTCGRVHLVNEVNTDAPGI